MCGIAGILGGPDAGPPTLEDLRRMVAMLRHRGPDGYGLYRDDRVGFGHARLSIIDLAGGSQPVHNEDKSVWVVFNGEIFNYLELRESLLGRGHRFYTQSDTEVIVHAYEEYGPQAWERFNGQFALALWDRWARRLWLVRDRVGILPLHYARAGDRVLFGSEAKALFASGHIAPRLSGKGVVEVFTRWAATAPQTVFQDVRSVPPGAAVCFDEELRESRHRYWQVDLAEDADRREMSVDEAADELGERLTQAVRLRLRADVPVGAYLSGGLDSSVIGGLIDRADSSPLQTFAIRFQDPAFDETAEQRRMAALLGTEHHEILCGSEEIASALPEVIWHCETPLLRTAPVPLFLLSGLVNRSGMKVVLTGEGADEILAGYDIFKEDKVRRFWARRPESQVRPALLLQLYPDVGQSAAKNSLWQQFFRRGLTEVDHPFYSHRIRWQNTAWGLRFLAPEVCDGVSPEQLEAETERALPDGWRRWTPLARAQMIEMHTFLSAYLLCCQGDRVAMGHSVEVRYPFLDPVVFEFCAHLPARLKLRGLRDKVSLRRLASRFLPPEIWQRPKKPYRAPMTQAFFVPEAPKYVAEVLSESALSRLGLVERKPAGLLIEKARRQAGRMAGEREEMALIGMLTLQLLGHFYLETFAGRVDEAVQGLGHVEPSVLEDQTSLRVRSPA
jgi:asparagine synthase (glutamine-hydrolysing)